MTIASVTAPNVTITAATGFANAHAAGATLIPDFDRKTLGTATATGTSVIALANRVGLAVNDVLRIGKQEVRVVEEEERLRRSALTTVQTDEDSDILRMEIHGKPRDPAVAEAINKLSNRELEVLKLVALGYAQRDIGEELGVSVKTVETYRARLNDKLGFKSRVDLVRFALAAGMLEEES